MKAQETGTRNNRCQIEGAIGNASVWSMRGPSQGSSERTAQTHSATPALSFCSFITAQKGDGIQLHGNLLDKDTLPRAASTEFCLAKQLLQMKMCCHPAGAGQGSRARQPHRYSPGCRDKSTQRPLTTARCQGEHGAVARPFCAFLCLSVPCFTLAEWELPGWCSTFSPRAV